MNLTADGFNDFYPKIGWCSGRLLKLKLPFWKCRLLQNSALWLPLLSSQWRSSVQPSCMQPWPENHPWCFNCRALDSTACFKRPWETTRHRWNSDGLSALIGVWFGGWKNEEPWKCLVIKLISGLFHFYPFSVSRSVWGLEVNWVHYCLHHGEVKQILNSQTVKPPKIQSVVFLKNYLGFPSALSPTFLSLYLSLTSVNSLHFFFRGLELVVF